MKLQDIINRLEPIFEDLGYVLFYGSKASYNAKRRDVGVKEATITPFDLPFSDICEFSTILTINLFKKRSKDAEFSNESQYSILNVDEMRADANKLYDKFNEQDWCLITQKREKMIFKFIDAQGAASMNQQDVATITFPIKFWING